MSHSVEDFYQKCQVLHEKSLMLHRERYKVSGSYNASSCQHIIDDIRALALEIIHGPIDLEIDFGKK